MGCEKSNKKACTKKTKLKPWHNCKVQTITPKLNSQSNEAHVETNGIHLYFLRLKFSCTQGIRSRKKGLYLILHFFLLLFWLDYKRYERSGLRERRNRTGCSCAPDAQDWPGSKFWQGESGASCSSLYCYGEKGDWVSGLLYVHLHGWVVMTHVPWGVLLAESVFWQIWG